MCTHFEVTAPATPARSHPDHQSSCRPRTTGSAGAAFGEHSVPCLFKQARLVSTTCLALAGKSPYVTAQLYSWLQQQTKEAR